MLRLSCAAATPQILERGQQISEASGKSKWRLMRMAICDMRESVYVGLRSRLSTSVRHWR